MITPRDETSSWSAKLKKGFRVTAWFRRGEIEEVARTVAAHSEAVDPFSGPIVTDAVVDDSMLTTDDVARLELDSTDSTSRTLDGRSTAPMAGRMSDREMAAELRDPRPSLLIFGCALAVIAIVLGACHWLLP